jgi:indolepyruvate ferredoxin oxidoreductase beta subunit
VTVDIYLVGVGGQGIITASRIIGEAAILSGAQVLLSETHGMAQRGGAVACTARIGDVAGPLIPDGQADVILSLELLETLRALPKASPRTLVVSSTEKIAPPSTSSRKSHYPTLEEVRVEVSKVVSKFLLIDARRFAEESGAPMSSNVVMVGALAGTGATGIERGLFEKAIERTVPRRIPENLDAFSKGFLAASQA